MVDIEVVNVPFIDSNFSPKHSDAVKKFMLSKAAKSTDRSDSNF